MRKTFNISQDRVDEETPATVDTTCAVPEDKPCSFEEREKKMRA